MKILVVSPHPDDETLGAGGTIFRLTSEGHKVYWLNVTNANDESRFPLEFCEKRKKQLKQITELYNFSATYQLDFETTKLDTYSSGEAIETISKIFEEVKPNLVLLPNPGDAHSDHKLTFDWCYACCKSFRAPYIKQIMIMEIISETDFGAPGNLFIPNTFVDISQYLEKKIKAMEVYNTELGEHPFPRNLKNIEALAITRGAMAGVKYAEAFQLIKCII